jgi:hypothetical protein
LVVAVAPGAAVVPTEAAVPAAAAAASGESYADEPAPIEVPGTSTRPPSESREGALVKSTSLLSPADLIAKLDAARSIAEQTWYGVNCYGKTGPMGTMPNGEVHGSRLPSGSTLRMGKVKDPLDPTRLVYLVRVAQDDVLTAGGKRCELIAYGDSVTHLPIGQDVWFGVSMLVSEGRLSKGDDQLLMQWHAHGFNPFFSILLRDGKLSAQIRYDASPTPSPATSKVVKLWTDTEPLQRRWMTFVVNARISPFESQAPIIRIWRDGRLLTQREGPLGYNTTQYHYARIGFYQWVNDINQWDGNAPVRSVMFSKSFIAKDPGRLYSEAIIRDQVEAR